MDLISSESLSRASEKPISKSSLSSALLSLIPSYYVHENFRFNRSMEPETRENEARPLITPLGAANYRTRLPRKLYICKDEIWQLETDKNTITKYPYLYVSYPPAQFDDKTELQWAIRYACSRFQLRAFWVDYLCLEENAEGQCEDLCIMGDVIRGASRTQVVIAPGDFSPRSNVWNQWCSRMWTLPELLLSRNLSYKLGNRHYVNSESKYLCKMVYDWENRDTETKLIYLFANAATGKNPSLESTDLIAPLIRVIWGGRHTVTLTDSLIERVCTLKAFTPQQGRLTEISSEASAFKELMALNGWDKYNFSYHFRPPPNVQEFLKGVTVPRDFFLDPSELQYPEIVMTYDTGKECWKIQRTVLTALRHDLLAVSYRQNTGMSLNVLEKKIRNLCKEFFSVESYWLDSSCMIGTEIGANYDLFHMADVFKSAKATLIVLPLLDSGVDIDMAWKKWGENIWSLSEIFLSSKLYYEAADGSMKFISKREAFTKAYGNNERNFVLIDAVEGNKAIFEQALWPYLVESIWSRTEGISGKLRINSFVSPPFGEKIFPKIETEKVYTLMTFMPVRTFPRTKETEKDALERLLMANDIKIPDFKNGVLKWCEANVSSEHYYPNLRNLLKLLGDKGTMNTLSKGKAPPRLDK